MELIVSSPWMLVCGAAGGMLNALVTDNRHLLPRTLSVSVSKQILRPGIVGNIAVGATATFAVLSMLANSGSVLNGRSTWGEYAFVLAAALIGLTAARAVTSEGDKQLLRAAVSKACAAPAAHPDALKTIDALTPLGVYTLADQLMPQRALFQQNDERVKTVGAS